MTVRSKPLPPRAPRLALALFIAAVVGAAPVPPDPQSQIGVVDGIPILQSEWDRLAEPYYEEVEARAGRPITEDEKRLLKRNVLEELIRERLWIADALRRGLTVTEAAVDSRMRQSAFFKTASGPDEAKFQAFKRSSTSNYPEISGQVRSALILEEYLRWLERRFGPREAELRKAFEERTSLATIRYFLLGPDAVSLEPEATAAQIRDYYDEHPDQFETSNEAHIQYVRFAETAPASRDSSGEAGGQATAIRSAYDFLSGVQAGAPAETVAKKFGGIHDSGWFRPGEPVRGLGRSEALTAAIRGAKPGAWTDEPIRVGASLVLFRLVERREPRRIPFLEAVPQAKRKADTAVRDQVLDSLARKQVRLNREEYRVPRVEASLVARALDSFDAGSAPSAKEVNKTLRELRERAGVSDTARAWEDSVRAGLPERILAERRLTKARKTMKDAVSRLKRGEPAGKVAAKIRGVATWFESYRGEPPEAPRLVEGALLDSLYGLRAGSVLGPLVARDSVFAVRLDRVDLDFMPPFEAVRAEARAAAVAAKRAALEREAESYFASHRQEYLTPPRWTFDYVLFPKPGADSVDVPRDSIEAYYRAHPAEFTEPGRARVRHILVTFRASDGPEARDASRQEAAAARKRLLAGEDFAAVAKEISDDPGSAPKGGDLGEITRGTVVKEFGDAAFTLPLGEVSDLVETRYGFHLLVVETRTPDRVRPLPECQAEIRGVLGTAYADSLARRDAEAFAAAASRPGAPFDSLAVPVGGARRSGPLSAGEPLGDIGRVPGLEKSIGSLPDGGVTRDPITIPTGFLVARKVSDVAPEEAPFAAVKDRAVSDFQAERRREIADSLNARFTPAVRAGADLDSLFLVFGGLRSSKEFGRSGPIPDLARDPSLARDSTYLSSVFSSRAGAVLPPLRGSGATLYSQVDSLAILPKSEFAKRRDTLLHEMIDQRIEAWTARLRSRATIRITRPDMRPLLG